MSDMQKVIERYIELWNEHDPASRRSILNDIWVEGGSYTDPLGAADGLPAIESMIAAAQQQFPGFVFRLGDVFDAHHNVVRFTWELLPAGGPESVVVGFDVAVAAADGRLNTVYGFLDKVPTS